VIFLSRSFGVEAATEHERANEKASAARIPKTRSLIGGRSPG